MPESKSVELLRLMSLLCGQPRRWRVVEMAAELEVNKRNIYRYLTDLGQFIPVTEEKGQYWVEGEALLSTLSFNQHELNTILLCLHSVPDAGLRDEMQSILERIKRSLNRAREHHVQQLAERIAQPASSAVQTAQHLQLITQALAGQRRLKVTYLSSSRDEPVERHLDPIGMWHHEGAWYFRAFDHLSRTQRTFRISRVVAVEDTGESFAPYAFDPDTRYERWDSPHGGERVRVVIEVDRDLARWLLENPVHSTQQVGDGRLSVQVTDVSRMVSWVAGLRGARILEPESLRLAVREHARSLLDD